MSLQVILNSDLKQIETNLTYESNDDDLSFNSHPENDTKFLKNFTENSFINAVVSAYNNHKGFTLSPDDIVMILSLGVCRYINGNPKLFRQFFVEHEGKEHLQVKVDSVNELSRAIDVLNKLVDEKTKLHLPLEPNFTTTTDTIRTSHQMMKLATFQKFFSFEMVCCCGISDVTLLGTQDDWKLLQEQYRDLKVVFKLMKYTRIDGWFSCMDIIMENLLRTRQLQDEGKVNAPKEIVDFWSRAVTYIPYGSGNQKYLSGWTQFLFPDSFPTLDSWNFPGADYTDEQKLEIMNRDVNNFPSKPNLLDFKQETPPKSESMDYYDYQKFLKEWAQIARSEVPSGMSSFPFKVTYGNTYVSHDFTLYTGFVGYVFENDSFRSVIGYRGMQDKYIEEGEEGEE